MGHRSVMAWVEQLKANVTLNLAFYSWTVFKPKPMGKAVHYET